MYTRRGRRRIPREVWAVTPAQKEKHEDKATRILLEVRSLARVLSGVQPMWDELHGQCRQEVYKLMAGLVFKSELQAKIRELKDIAKAVQVRQSASKKKKRR
jgi:hypothetical protein